MTCKRRVLPTTMLQRSLLVAAAFALIAHTGCRLSRSGMRLGSPSPAPPTVLAPGATAAQVVAAVNQNTSRIQSYTAPNASFTTPGLPGVPLLKGSIVLERPRRFRLRAGTALSGGEVDLGSNDDLFWLWAKRNDPPAVYFARHDQHATGAARMLLPIDPAWVVDALGLVTLDPTAAYQGPLPRPDGSLELRHAVAGPSGTTQRVTVVEPTRAWVIEQHAYDAAGTLIASSTARDFRYDAAAQVSLPRRVTIRVPNADISLTVNTGAVAVNTPVANPGQHWTLPTIEGYPLVDLGRSDGLPATAGSPVNQFGVIGATAAQNVQRRPVGGVAVPTTSGRR
ncbi:MAG: hypothetical protein AAGJ46_20290 [Planctomycetota bacterium]